MSQMQPGSGYTFKASSSGTTLNIDTPFVFYDFADGENTAPMHPYKVINANSSTFQVVPGTLNNNPTVVDGTQGLSPDWLTDVPPPTLSWDWNISTDKSYVYLVAGPDSSTHIYPSDNSEHDSYPGVAAFSDLLTDNDDYGYLLLAEAKLNTADSTVTVTQYVTGSLWADRIKLGTLTAKYYYARI